jgi:hypothetical protein
MKRVFVFLATILFSASVFATGKLTLQNNLYDGGKTYRPMVGFGIYQPLFKWAAVNLWSGYGVMPLEATDDTQWLVAKGHVDMYFGKWTIAPGVQVKKLLSGDREEVANAYLKVEYKLW